MTDPAWLLGTAGVSSVSLASVWLLGMSMGLTACTVTCLPFMGTWVMGQMADRRQALGHTALFLAGRLSVYVLLGGIAGSLGQWLSRWLAGGWGNGAIGVASLVAGFWLLRAPRSAGCPGRRGGAGMPPYLLGATLALTPCAPLTSLLTLAALDGRGWEGAGLGLAFGLGAAVTPLLVLVPACAWFGRRLREERAWISRWITQGAAGVLWLLGLRRLLSLL